PNTNRLELTIKVIDAGMIQPVNPQSLRNWFVQAEVVSGPTNEPSATNYVGGQMMVAVHSVAQTFHEDVNKIKGKTYRVVYLEPFRNLYVGDIEVLGPATNSVAR